ncbi:MAG: hypothetical protein NC489_44650 [Ruminococcus flavefaciens]|nr:hypothetical protein [Ruminococcus flavefaciens]
MSDVYMTSLEVCRLLQIDISVLNRLEKEAILLPKRKLPYNGKRLYDKKDVIEYFQNVGGRI